MSNVTLENIKREFENEGELSSVCVKTIKSGPRGKFSSDFLGDTAE